MLLMSLYLLQDEQDFLDDFLKSPDPSKGFNGVTCYLYSFLLLNIQIYLTNV